jgi:hypothetical protein
VASSRSSSASSWASVADAILETPGALSPDVRRAIRDGNDPPDLAPLLAKVRERAHAIVDADLSGLGADVVIEATLAAALGVALRDRARAFEALG